MLTFSFQGDCYSCGDDTSRCAPVGIRSNLYPVKNRTNVKLYYITPSSSPFCGTIKAFFKELLIITFPNLIIYVHSLSIRHQNQNNQQCFHDVKKPKGCIIHLFEGRQWLYKLSCSVRRFQVYILNMLKYEPVSIIFCLNFEITV